MWVIPGVLLISIKSHQTIISMKLFCPFLPNLSLTRSQRSGGDPSGMSLPSWVISAVLYIHLVPSQSTVGVWKNGFVKVGKLLGKTIFSDNGVPDTLNI